MPKRQDEDDDSSQNSESTSDSHLCCCLCYCAVDYSDKEAFYGYEEDSDEDENAKPKPRLLPKQLYDAQNALVLCDSCDRPYHQRCHFVPVVSLPRGDWHCLLCKDESEQANSPAKGKKKKQVIHTDDVYPFPPKDENGEILFDEENQREWEFASSQLKAVAWKREFARLQRALSLQLQTVRLAEDSIRSHTTSSRKTHTITNPLKSQELCQCFVRLATSKLKVRQWMLSLEKVRNCWNGDWNMLEAFLTENEDQQDTWFPYGRDLQRRVIPRCGHEEDEEEESDANKVQNENDKKESGVPTEVVLKNNASTATKSNNKTDNDNNPEEEDDDDMISLDDLQCCICLVGDASDENDVILCDGENCFRAYHMNCVSPHATLEQVEEEDDWFCPICTAMAKLIASIQSEYTGDDWKADNDDETTIRSWDRANDVFPEAEKEYEMAIKWKDGQQDAEMAAFISTVLGMSIEAGSGSNTGLESQEGDDEDDSDDEDFDLKDLEKQKQADEQDDESESSSKASLGDLSDVEGKIDRSELDALSLPSDEASDEDDNAGEGRHRTRSARSSRAASANNSSGDESSSSNQIDAGTLDESNIVRGKRRRSQVDYRRLNDSMFGDVSENEAAKMDDDDEFRAKIPSRRNSSSSNSTSGSEEESGSEDGSSASGSEKDGSSSDGDSDKRSTTKSMKRSSVKKNLSSDGDGSDDSRKQGPPIHAEKGEMAKKKRSTRAAKKKKQNSSDDGSSSGGPLEQKQQRKKPVQKKVSGKAATNGRKRRASRQDISEGSSSNGGTPNGKTNRKSETWNEKSPTSINGKKNRRSKRAKWENLRS